MKTYTVNLHRPTYQFLLDDGARFTKISIDNLMGEVMIAKDVHTAMNNNFSGYQININKVGFKIISVDWEKHQIEIVPTGPYKSEVELACDPDEDALHAIAVPRIFFDSTKDKYQFPTIDLVLLNTWYGKN